MACFLNVFTHARIKYDNDDVDDSSGTICLENSVPDIVYQRCHMSRFYLAVSDERNDVIEIHDT